MKRHVAKLYESIIRYQRCEIVYNVVQYLYGCYNSFTICLILLDDIWPQWERKEDEKEPDWVQSEREQFFQHRDKDNDKRLSRVRPLMYFII